MLKFSRLTKHLTSNYVKNHTLTSFSCFSTTQKLESYGISLIKYGKPLDSYEVVQEKISFDKNHDQLLLKTIVSPIHPSDVNIMQGTYGTLPRSLPSFIGNEGLFEIVDIGNGVSSTVICLFFLFFLFLFN